MTSDRTLLEPHLCLKSHMALLPQATFPPDQSTTGTTTLTTTLACHDDHTWDESLVEVYHNNITKLPIHYLLDSHYLYLKIVSRPVRVYSFKKNCLKL